MKKVIILSGNTNYDKTKAFSKLRELPEYIPIIYPETEILHPTLQCMFSQQIRENSIIITFNENIITSLIFSALQEEIDLEIYYNNHKLKIDELGYIIDDEYSEGFLEAELELIRKLNRFRLEKLDSDNEM